MNASRHRWRVPIPSFVGVVLLCLAWASLSQAATYYVSPTTASPAGSNSNSGLTEALPLATIAYCISTKARTSGDVCLVKNGTYTETITMNASGITLKNFPSHAPKIAFSSVDSTLLIYSGSLTSTLTNLRVEGLEITGGHDCIKYNSVDTLALVGNYLHDCTNNGILGTGHAITIDRNRIVQNGNWATCTGIGTPNGCNVFHGMYVTGTAYLISNNLIYDNTAYGIQAAAYPYVAGSFGATNQAGFAGTIANNTIAYQKHSSGIVLWDNAGRITNTDVVNNICYENSQLNGSSSQCIDYVSWNGADSGVTVRNNLWYATGNSATTFSACSSSCTGGVGSTVTVTNTTNANPLFVNGPATIPTSPDFHPQSTSPAIGIGLNLTSSFTTDNAGTARSATLPWTDGAYTTTGGSGGSGGGGGTNQTVLVWSDTFNRAAEDPLTASNWVRNSAVGHQFVIPSNLATIAQPKLFSAGDAAMVWITNALNADQYCKFVIGTVSTTGDNTVGYGCSVRTANGTKSDYALVTSSLGYDIRRDLAGSYTSLLKGSGTTLTSGESGMLAVHGSGSNVVLEAFKNNSATPFATVTDSSVSALQSGYAGIFYSSSETGQTPGSSTHGIDYVEGGNYFYGVDITAPTAPTGLTVTANLPAQLLISWTASTDAVGVTGYNVQRCTPSVCTPSVIVNSPTTTTYTDTGLADATGYSYRVNGFDAAANQSAYSSVVSQTTQTVASPTISNCFPSGAAVSDAASIVINCTSSIPATGKYNTRTQGTAAYASLQQSMTCSGLVCSATVTPDQHGSNGGVNHFYVAFDNATSPGHASATTDLTFTMIAPVDSTAPTTISDFALTAIDSVRLGATWSAATDAVGLTGYLLSGCPGAGCTTYTITLNVAPGTSGIITGLDPSTVYNFINQAYDAAGNLGVASNVATQSTFAAAPPEDMLNLSVAAIFQQTVILQWTAPIVEQPKAIFEQCTPKTSATTCGGAWVQAATIPLGTLPVIQNLSPGTSYCARGKYGNSQNAVSANASNVYCFTTAGTGQTQQRQPAFIPRIQRQ